MKLKEKEEARRLRKEDGMSMNEIVKTLKVSKSSVSLWVRDVELTDEQIKILDAKMIENRFGKRGNGYKKMLLVTERSRKLHKDIRRGYQEEGRKLFNKCKNNPDFIAGIMLYWAEGSKSRCSVKFSNSDMDMMIIFVRFLRKYFKINNNKLAFAIQYYTGNGISQDDVENFWMNHLGLNYSNKRKCYIDYRPVKNMGKKVGKCPYGICRIVYNDVEIMQKIYGAIKEFSNIDNDKWLD